MRISDWSSDVCSSDLVVHDHDVAGCERRREELLDIGAEEFSGHRAVDHVGRIEPVMARPGNKGCGFPMDMWNRNDEPVTFGASAIGARHLGGRPGLVEGDKVKWVQAGDREGGGGGKR